MTKERFRFGVEATTGWPVRSFGFHGGGERTGQAGFPAAPTI